MAADDNRAVELYLDLLKRSLTRFGYGDSWKLVEPRATGWRAKLYDEIETRTGRAVSYTRVPFDPKAREIGRDWPVEAETMIGLKRLDNLQELVADVIRNDVPGDLIETGVWRGGATIFMRAILAAYGDTRRVVWVADSFAGLPRPNAEYEADQNDKHWSYTGLAVSEEEVRANFARYGLLDDQVRFLKGLFQDTLADAPIDQLSILRLDGDMYESTIVALDALYPKLSVGGYLIVDDYGALEPCRRAVDDYRRDHGISEPLVEVDWTGVYWQRAS
jgi:O-methyltransferase